MINGDIETNLTKPERMKETADLAAGLVLTMLVGYGVILFQRNVMTGFPQALRLALRFPLAWLVALPAIAILLIRRDRLVTLRPTKRGLPAQLAVGVLLGILLSAAVHGLLYLLSALGAITFTPAKSELRLFDSLYKLAYFLIAIGASEEFIFRCFFYEKLKRVFNTELAAVLGSALIFALFHVINGSSIVNLALIFIIGIVFAVSRLKLKSCTLLSLIVMHGVYDWLGGIIPALF